mgnify:CR=1 FL=1
MQHIDFWLTECEFDESFDEYIPLDEARIQIEQREIAEGNISSGEVKSISVALNF